MDGRNTKGIGRMVGKTVEIIFQDSETSSSKREGELIGHDNKFLVISSCSGVDESLPISRIIRIKELRGGCSR